MNQAGGTISTLIARFLWPRILKSTTMQIRMRSAFKNARRGLKPRCPGHVGCTYSPVRPFPSANVKRGNFAIPDHLDHRRRIKRPNFDFQRVSPAHEERYPHPSNISSQDARNAFRNSTKVGSAGKYSPASKLCT